MIESGLSGNNHIILVSWTIPAFLSAFASFVVLLSITIFRPLRTSSFYLIGALHSALILNNLSRLLFISPPDQDSWQCSFQPWIANCGLAGIIYISIFFSHHMYCSITRIGYKLTMTRLTWVLFGMVLYSVLMSSIPLLTSQYGRSGPACTILTDGSHGTNEKTGIYMINFLFIGPFWVACGFCSFSYITIYRYIITIKKSLRANVAFLNSTSPSAVERTVYRLQYYPAILILSWSFRTISRTLEVTGVTHASTWVTCVGLVCIQMQGLLNTAVFFSYPRVTICWRILLGLPDAYPPFPPQVERPQLEDNKSSGDKTITHLLNTVPSGQPLDGSSRRRYFGRSSGGFDTDDDPDEERVFHIVCRSGNELRQSILVMYSPSGPDKLFTRSDDSAANPFLAALSEASPAPFSMNASNEICSRGGFS